MIDALLQFLAGIEPYHWLALGLVLLVAEMFTGTMHLLWPAIAAGVTGLVAFILPTGGLTELAIFAAVEVGLVIFGAPFAQKLRSGGSPNLNERGQSLIGVRGAAAEAFINGVGAVKIQDTVWRAVSDDAIVAGAAVDVVGVDGATLRVKSV